MEPIRIFQTVSIRGVRRLLANYFPAACECFTWVPEPPNWSQFSRSPALPPCCKEYELTPHPFIYALFGVLTGRREVARQVKNLRIARDRAVSERLGALMPFLLAQDE